MGLLLVESCDISRQCRGMLIYSHYSDYYCTYRVESAIDVPKAGSAKYQKEPQCERMEVWSVTCVWIM